MKMASNVLDKSLLSPPPVLRGRAREGDVKMLNAEWRMLNEESAIPVLYSAFSSGHSAFTPPPPQPSPGAPGEGVPARNAARESEKRSVLLLAVFYALLLGLYLCSTASAKPTQQDVFRSIEDNVKESNESGGKMLLFLGAGVALVLLLALFGRRQQQKETPKSLNNPGKLTRQLCSALSLKKPELKQLKLVADQTTAADEQPLTSPLVLLLCPSVLVKAVQSKSPKLDRKVLAKLVRRTTSA
jgi:hypothetical protein